MRKWITINTEEISIEKLLIQKAAACEHSLILYDGHPDQTGCYARLKNENFLAGFEAIEIVECSPHSIKDHLSKNDWYFGFLSYDLKNKLHPRLSQKQAARVNFPDMAFFRPRWIVRRINEQWQVGYDYQQNSEKKALSWIDSLRHTPVSLPNPSATLEIEQILSEAEYTRRFHILQNHIKRGDIYELNFCMEFYADNAVIDAADKFMRLMELSPMPFSAFLKYGDKHALSASPERYLAKRGKKIYSMPMKGTARRGSNIQEDSFILQNLKNSEKERSENIMITDLVRNDLSFTADKASVQVDELCGIYPFPNVFQMVSTVSSTLKEPDDWSSPILSTFPMGSMTGAPKLSAMQLIDRYEERSRGLFSGAIGYISPEKDFDFNVVIRSLLYDSGKQTISISAGSAITAQANASDEYNECLLKAEIVVNKLLGEG